MRKLFIIRHSELDKYGDEYLVHDFVSAATTQNAWFMAGARLASGSVICEGDGFFNDGLETFSVDVLTPEDYEFWDVFDSFGEWIDDFLVWAIQHRETAARIHDMAEACDPPCHGLLNLEQFVSLVEQYKIEQAILDKTASTPSKKPKSL
jgi:hypothetical protein